MTVLLYALRNWMRKVINWTRNASITVRINAMAVSGGHHSTLLPKTRRDSIPDIHLLTYPTFNNKGSVHRGDVKWQMDKHA